MVASETEGKVAYDCDAEGWTLGIALVAPRTVPMILTSLEAGDFFCPEHPPVFEAIKAVNTRGDTVNAISVADELDRRGVARDKAKPLLADLVHVAGFADEHDARTATKMVRDHAARRRVMDLARQLQHRAGDALDLSELSLITEEITRHLRPTRTSNDIAVDGETFLREVESESPVWGEGERVLWSSGETMMLVGPQGAGKTTLAQQLALARIGYIDSVLGFPVEPEARRVLYVAADRPRQAKRSLRRMVPEHDRHMLRERLTVWGGPLEADLSDRPTLLAEVAERHDAGTIIIDSLKDVAVDLVKDETGSRVNYALQTAVAAGLEVLVLHHQRKQQQGGGKPTKLADVYGSTWITAGTGSVVLVWGDSGDLVVELSHLKQPVAEVGPMRVIHDHARGTSSVVEQADVRSLLAEAREGLTAKDAAQVLFDVEEPSRNHIEKARRRLDELVNRGEARREAGRAGGSRGGSPVRWYASESVHGSVHAGSVAQSVHAEGLPFTPEGISAGQSVHATVHAVHEPGRSRIPPSLEGERGPDGVDDDKVKELLEAFPGSTIEEEP